MARITTRDCERVVANRFELVLLAAYRAHELWNGAEPQVVARGEKPTVVALREIAAERIDPTLLRQQVVKHLMRSEMEVSNVRKPPIQELALPSSSSRLPAEPLEERAPASVH